MNVYKSSKVNLKKRKNVLVKTLDFITFDVLLPTLFNFHILLIYPFSFYVYFLDYVRLYILLSYNG